MSHAARPPAPTGGAVLPQHFAMILAATFLWGTGAVAGTLLGRTESLPPATVAMLRMAIGGLALLVVAVARGQLRLGRMSRAADIRIVGTALTAAVFEFCYFSAFYELTVSIAIFIVLGTTPVLVAAWTAITERRRPPTAVLLAMPVALAGLALLVLTSDVGHISWRGVAYAVGAGAAYAVQVIINRVPVAGLPPIALGASSMLLAALFLLPFSILGGLALPASGNGWALLGYAAVIASAVPYVLYLTGLRTVPGTIVAIVTLAEPVVAVIGGVAFLGDRMTPRAVLGGLLMMAAVVLVRPRKAPVGAAVGAAVAPGGEAGVVADFGAEVGEFGVADDAGGRAEPDDVAGGRPRQDDVAGGRAEPEDVAGGRAEPEDVAGGGAGQAEHLVDVSGADLLPEVAGGHRAPGSDSLFRPPSSAHGETDAEEPEPTTG